MITHKRVRIQNGKVEESPLQYTGIHSKSNGWTDIRVAEILPVALLDSEVILQVGSVVSISKAHSAKHQGAWLYINGPFFDKTSKQVLGKTIMDGKVILPDVPATVKRPHLYCLDNGKIDIGRVDDPTGVKWAVCGYTLVKDGKYVFPVPDEQIKSDIANGYNQRMLAGIKPDGTFIPMMIDEGPNDKGMTQSQCAMYLMAIGCTKVIGLDGGGSSTEATSDSDLINALDLKNGYHVAEVGSTPRDVHHALAFKLDKNVLFSKPLFGIDCATPLTATTAKALAAEGVKFACRYLTLAKYEWKKLTSAEVTAIHAAGMKLVSVWETTAGRAAGGATAGKEDGILALKEAQSVGQPKGTVIFFAVDYDAKANDHMAIEAYLKAAAIQIPGYKIGVYGSYSVCLTMFNLGIKYLWQTYAWSGGKFTDHANIYQYKNDTKLVDVSLDLNEAYNEDCFWTPATSTIPQPDTQTKSIPLVQGFIPVDGDNGIEYEGLLINGLTYLPIRELGEALNAEIGWDQINKRASIKGNHFS